MPDDITYFGRSTTFNPFLNAQDLKTVSNEIFTIQDTSPFANTRALLVSTGLVPTEVSLFTDFKAEIINTDGSVRKNLIARVGEVGGNKQPSEDEILWFDVEGAQGDYWIHDSYAGLHLRLSGKFDASAITAAAMNKIKTDMSDIVNNMKNAPPPIDATYTQWNINAPTPQSKWAGTTWKVVSTKKVLIKTSTFTNPVNNATHWLDNNTSHIECECIGGGGAGGQYAGGAGGESSINYNGVLITGGGGGGAGGGYGGCFGGSGGDGYHNNGNGGKGGVAGGGGGNGSDYGSYSSDRYTHYKGGNGGLGGGRQGESYNDFNIVSSVRNLVYTVGKGGGNGGNGLIAIREFTTETIYIRTA